MKKLLVGIVVLVAWYFTSKTIVQNKIDENIKNLANNGIAVQITNQNGIFTQTREFDLHVSDERKFITFALNSYANIVKEHKKLIDAVITKLDKVPPIFQKALFKGSLQNSLINPFADIFINIYPQNQNLKNADILQNLLQNKIINFDIIASNDGQIKKISLKDINETIENKYNKIEDKLQGFSIDLHNKNSFDAKITLDKLLHKNNVYESVQIDNLKLNSKFINFYNNEFDLDVKNTAFGLHLIANATIKDMFLDGYVKSYNDKFKNQMGLNIKNLHIFQDQKDIANVDDIALNFELFDIDFQTYQKMEELSIQNFTNKINGKYESLDNQIMQMAIQLVQKGFKANLKLNLGEIHVLNEHAKDINFKANVDIKNQNEPVKVISSLELKNLKLSKPELNLGKININSTLNLNMHNLKVTQEVLISFEEKDFPQILANLPQDISSRLKTYAKIKNSLVSFNIKSTANKIISINDNPL